MSHSLSLCKIFTHVHHTTSPLQIFMHWFSLDRLLLNLLIPFLNPGWFPGLSISLLMIFFILHFFIGNLFQWIVVWTLLATAALLQMYTILSFLPNHFLFNSHLVLTIDFCCMQANSFPEIPILFHFVSEPLYWPLSGSLSILLSHRTAVLVTSADTVFALGFLQIFLNCWTHCSQLLLLSSLYHLQSSSLCLLCYSHFCLSSSAHWFLIFFLCLLCSSHSHFCLSSSAHCFVISSFSFANLLHFNSIISSNHIDFWY